MKKLSLFIMLISSTISTFAQWTSSGANAYFNLSGNVGIGTSSPSSYFHGGTNKVLEIFNSNTSLNSQSHVILSSGSILDGSSAGTITWLSKNSTNFQGMAYIGSIVQGTASASASGNLVFATSNGSNLLPRMTLDKNGNLGIGTGTPTAPLSIVNSSPAIQLYDTHVNPADGSSMGGLYFGSNQSFASLEALRQGSSYDDVTNLVFRTSFSLGAGGDGNNKERMRIAYNGFVGIGTATPREALSVNGNIRSKEVKVETSNWPDYVFKPDYRLSSLSTLKSYIDENGHLPEMPSAQQVQNEGQKLGEINKILVKKVEELTLYLIQIDKKLNSQNSEIQQLKRARVKPKR